MVQNKGNGNKELKFNNCSESDTYLCSRTFVQHISIICITLKAFLKSLEHFTTIQEPVGSKIVRKYKMSLKKFSKN